MCKSLAVSAKHTLFHCSIRANRCLHRRQDSRKVRHRGGDGKFLSQATNQTLKRNRYRIDLNTCFIRRKINSTSSKTPKTLSQSCSPASSRTAGGASKASLIPMRNSNRLSQVSLSKAVGPLATCCSVLNTLWQSTACLLIVSVPEKCRKINIKICSLELLLFFVNENWKNCWRCFNDLYNIIIHVWLPKSWYKKDQTTLRRE